MTGLQEMVNWLNSYMKLGDFIEDKSLNGLQVEAGTEVTKVALAVDASMEAFRKAKHEGADLILVHHGMYWSHVDPLIRGATSDRVRYLMENKLSLYCAHLPLDAHSQVGNNVEILKAMGFKPKHKVNKIIWTCQPKRELENIVERVKKAVGEPVKVLEFGDKTVNELWVCSGQATDMVLSAPKGATVILGEFAHYGYHYAKERQLNVIEAGHYNTERFGVIALGNLIQQKFKVPTFFVDAPTGI